MLEGKGDSLRSSLFQFTDDLRFFGFLQAFDDPILRFFAGFHQDIVFKFPADDRCQAQKLLRILWQA